MQALEKPISTVIVGSGQTLPNKFTCVSCHAEFESAHLQRCHFKTDWHLYNLKRRVCKLDPIKLDNFNEIQASSQAEKMVVKEQKSKLKPRSANDLYKDSSETNHNTNRPGDDENDWESIDEEDLLDEDYDEKEVDEMLARVVESDACLFCDKKGENMATNLKHMNSMHGFFIPEEQYLMDLEGLMEYLGFKVGAGATCLWCEKQFSSLHGVRLHMLYKDHCKIMYNQEKATSEFKDFYDYSGQQLIPMKPLNQLDIYRKRIDRHNHQRNDRSIATIRSSSNNKIISTATRSAIRIKEKAIKKFNARRAQNLLRLGMTNNQVARGRLRQQNPI